MSTDSEYLISLEGPFGDGEIEGTLVKLNEMPSSQGFTQLGYATLYGQTKWSHDNEVIEACKTTSVIMILTANENSRRWKVIYDPFDPLLTPSK